MQTRFAQRLAKLLQLTTLVATCATFATQAAVTVNITLDGWAGFQASNPGNNAQLNVSLLRSNTAADANDHYNTRVGVYFPVFTSNTTQSTGGMTAGYYSVVANHANYSQALNCTSTPIDPFNYQYFADGSTVNITITCVPPNSPPTDITLSNTSLNQSAGINATVGTLTSTDVDGGAFTYTLVSGTGSTNNTSFNISGSTLRANNAAALAAGSYSVRIQTRDSANATFQKAFSLSVADDVAPTISSVNATTANGSYKVGDTISIQVNFTEVVTVTGTPQLTLETGVTDRVASYSSGSGSNTLNFSYTIQAGDSSADLDYVSPTALALSGATIRDAASNNATLTLPNPGAAGSLANNKAIVIDGVAPSVTDARIGISGASGIAGAYRIGDTVTATWNNTGSGDNNTDIASVTVDFSQFGGGSAVTASNSSSTWTATYTITAGTIDAINRNITITVTDSVGNITTTTDSSNASIDSIAPSVSDANISISGASGSGGAFIIGDTLTATWNNTAGGDNNSDTISAVTVDFSPFGGGAAVAATNNSGTWTASYNIHAGSSAGSNKNVSVSAIDNAGNVTTRADSSNATVTLLTAQSITFANPGAQNFGTTPTLSATASSGLTVTFSSSTTAVCTVTGAGALTFVTAGSCTINADQAGDGTYSAAPQVSRTFSVNAVVAAAPTIGTATAGNTQATVSFVAPTFTGGTAITGYTVTSNPGGFTGTGSASPIAVNGLNNGTNYTFTVTATNSAGTSSASAASNAVTPAAPQSITFNNPGAQSFGTTPTLTATSDSGLTVSFSSVTPAVCTISSGGTLTFNTTGSCSINANQAGSSAYLPATEVNRSFSVNAVTPDAPTIGVATASSQQATVTFTPPSFNGGAAISVYRVTANPGGITGSGLSSPLTVTGLTNGTTYTFTVQAQNSAGFGAASAASNSVTPNAAPTISGTPVTTVAQDSAYSFTPTASDIDVGTTLTFSISNKPSWASFNTATGTLSGTPGNSDVGSTAGIVISVSDGSLSAALPAFTLEVTNTNDAPTISGTPLTTVAQDSAYSFTPTASDIDVGTTLTFSISNKPAWASFNTATGTLSGTPGNSDVGSTAGIVISVSDGSLSAALPAFTLEVTNTNDAPTISGTPLTTVAQDSAYSFTPTASDIDVGTTLTFSISNKPSWASFNTATGTLSGTPGNSDVGSTAGIVISVSDGSLSAALPAFNLNVTNTNDAPTISGTPLTTVAQDSAYSFTPTASDIDVGTTLTFSISNKPSWASFNTATGTLSGTPGNSDVGSTAGIVISVSDGSLSAVLPAFTLEVINTNDAPTISGTPLTTVVQDTAYSFTPAASDIDVGTTLTFSISNKPTWASFNTATGTLSGTPGNSDVGSTAGIVISVSDGSLSAALPAFNLNVTNTNDAPTISGTPLTTVAQDTAYSFTPAASDIDVGTTLTFSISNKPTWASFNTATGTLSGTPGNSDVGSTAGIVISVSDGSLSAALPAFNLNVTNTNDAPTISGTPLTTVAQDTAYSFTPTASDIDVGTTLTFSISNKPSWASFNTATGTLSGTPGNEHVGATKDIVISVSDGELSSSLAAFTLTVVNINDAPTANNDNFSLPIAADSVYILHVLTNDTDPDDDVLQITSASSSVGQVSVVNNALRFTPGDNFTGQTNLQYRISDGALTATADVDVNITGDNALAPRITVPEDIEVNASGLFTKVDLGNISARDTKGNRLAVSLLNGKPLFAPGKHQAYWKATDSAGISSISTQTVMVHPLVALSKPQQVGANSAVTVSVLLNGDAPQYPVDINYTVSGSALALSDHDLVSGTVQITSGTSAEIHFNVFADLALVPSKDIVITLDENLNLGANAQTRITVTNTNSAPEVKLQASQNAVIRTQLSKTEGLVTVSGLVSDMNTSDTISLTWQSDTLVNTSSDPAQFVFDPAGLTAGVHELRLTATDNGTPALSTTRTINLLVLNNLPTLGNNDSNGNLIPDSEEGNGDRNSNGIPDYLDPGLSCQAIPERLQQTDRFIGESEPGVCLAKGATALLTNTGGIELGSDILSTIEPDMQASNTGGLFDFILSELPQAGQTIRVVIPQQLPVPAGAVYRKYTAAAGWQDFVINANNQLFSTSGEAGFCPPPGDDSWQPGLTEGHWCVQLAIEDGGPNDADSIANNSIVDPGGVAVPFSTNTLPVAVADAFNLQWNESQELAVLSNDTDADGDNLTISQISADFGQVSISSDKTKLIYTPAVDFIGTDTLIYGVSDGKGGTASAQATVVVYFNQAPRVVSLTASTDDRTAIDINVLANASDADGDTLSIIDAAATEGTLTITNGTMLRYAPKAGFDGTDTINFTVSDGRGGLAQAQVQVTVNAYEVITVVNKSSGGSVSGWPVAFLSLLLALRRRRVIASAVIALLSGISFSSQANWSVESLYGRSQAKLSASTINALLPAGTEVVQYDDRGRSWALGLNYHFTPRLAVQAQYVDLGESSLTLRADTLTPDAFYQAVQNIGPMQAEGIRSGLDYQLWQYALWSAGVHAGVFIWQSDSTSTAGDKAVRYQAEDTDAYWGLSASFALDRHVALKTGFTRYQLDGNKVDNLMLGIRYAF